MDPSGKSPDASDSSGALQNSANDQGFGDVVVVHDRSSRRRFIRSGSAFLLGSSVVLGQSRVYGDICDSGRARKPDANNPKKAENGSDADAGENADPIGCGKHRNDAPKISALDAGHELQNESVEVASIKG